MKKDQNLKLRKKIDPNNIPEHIAIIMDGNGRWARERFLPRTVGHKEGMKRVIDIVEVAEKLNIKVDNVYTMCSDEELKIEEL